MSISRSCVHTFKPPVFEWPKDAPALHISTVTNLRSLIGHYYTRSELCSSGKTLEVEAYVIKTDLSYKDLILSQPDLEANECWIHPNSRTITFMRQPDKQKKTRPSEGYYTAREKAISIPPSAPINRIFRPSHKQQLAD